MMINHYIIKGEISMKINVTGRGRVPGINALAPVYNREADIPLIKRILAYRVFRVFDCESGLQITTKNLCEFAKVELEEKEAANRLNINVPNMEKVVIKPIPKEDVPVIEAKPFIPPMVEPEVEVALDAEIVDYADEEPSDVIEEVDVPENTDDISTTNEDEVVSETDTVVEEVTDNNYRSKRNKKKRH
jgi:hypothetical protein